MIGFVIYAHHGEGVISEGDKLVDKYFEDLIPKDDKKRGVHRDNIEYNPSTCSSGEEKPAYTDSDDEDKISYSDENWFFK